MSYSFVAACLTVCGLLFWYHKRSRRFIANLPGPPPDSWLVGNIPGFQRKADGNDADFEWTKRYGTAIRLKGCIGEDVLYVSDPKALQYILNTSGYNFPKTWEARVLGILTTGRGLITVDGAPHARQRRIMNPSFSHSALKGLLPLFWDVSQRTTTTWKAKVCKNDPKTSVIDVWSMLGNTTLDTIGEAAFGYKFNSIEGVEPPTDLQKSYHNLFVDLEFMTSNLDTVFRRLMGYAPTWLSDLLILLPKKDLKRLNNYMHVARDVAKDLVAKQMHAHATGKEGGKDVMSIFVRANTAEDPSKRLKEDEILSQITTLMLAGHETTANSLSWMLHELSKHPDVQRKLQEEVRATIADVASRGDSEITISDLDSMTYMAAVMKETLRYHPVAIQLFRRAAHDDVIPLEIPQRSVSGETITAVPVREGQVVQLGLATYNRLPEVWGEDADTWRPERFLEGKKHKTKLGVLGNLSTFSSGLRSCIGWRFAMIEMQAVLFSLMDTFEFSPAPGVEIRRAGSRTMQSMVKGRESEGAQMPLTVSISSQDAD